MTNCCPERGAIGIDTVVTAPGTELSATEQRPQWHAVIGEARALYPGLLLYFAHNLEDAERVPFWGELDAIGATLYPPLGSDADRAGRYATMHAIAVLPLAMGRSSLDHENPP